MQRVVGFPAVVVVVVVVVGAEGEGGGGGRRGSEEGVRGEDGVFAQGDGGDGRCGAFRGGGGGGGGAGGEEVAADAGERVDDAAAAEGDLLGAVELGAAGDFVPGFGFDPVGFLGGGVGFAVAGGCEGRHGRWC